MTDESEVLRKIGLLLAKAEGTDNEAEASIFFEKAQELMVRFAIDEARVRAAAKAGNRPVEEPVLEDYMFASYAHHAEAKSDLLEAICRANSVRFWPYPNDKGSNHRRVAAAGLSGLYESQWTRLVGYASDIAAVKLLYLSLLIQAQRFANEDWRIRYGSAKKSDWDDGHVGKFSWITTHMKGFSERIAERFVELTEAIYADVPDSRGLIFDKNANIREWMYDKGYASRPNPNAVVAYKPRCYAVGFPPHVRVRYDKSGKPVSIPYECMLEEGHNEGVDATPHIYSQKQIRTYTSYWPKGRSESRYAGEAGRNAADRADIGLSRVHAGVSRLGRG